MGLTSLYGSESQLQTFIDGWLSRHFGVMLRTKISEDGIYTLDVHDVVNALEVSFARIISEGK